MKILISLLAFIFCSNFMFAQQKKDSLDIKPVNSSINYKPTMRTANILLGIGGGLIVIGGIIIATDSAKNDFLISANELIGGTFILAGAVSGLASIPFYIIAYNKKRKMLTFSPIININRQELMGSSIQTTNFGVSVQF